MYLQQKYLVSMLCWFAVLSFTFAQTTSITTDWGTQRPTITFTANGQVYTIDSDTTIAVPYCGEDEVCTSTSTRSPSRSLSLDVTPCPAFQGVIPGGLSMFCPIESSSSSPTGCAGNECSPTAITAGSTSSPTPQAATTPFKCDSSDCRMITSITETTATTTTISSLTSTSECAGLECTPGSSTIKETTFMTTTTGTTTFKTTPTSSKSVTFSTFAPYTDCSGTDCPDTAITSCEKYDLTLPVASSVIGSSTFSSIASYSTNSLFVPTSQAPPSATPPTVSSSPPAEVITVGDTTLTKTTTVYTTTCPNGEITTIVSTIPPEADKIATTVIYASNLTGSFVSETQSTSTLESESSTSTSEGASLLRSVESSTSAATATTTTRGSTRVNTLFSTLSTTIVSTLAVSASSATVTPTEPDEAVTASTRSDVETTTSSYASTLNSPVTPPLSNSAPASVSEVSHAPFTVVEANGALKYTPAVIFLVAAILW